MPVLETERLVLRPRRPDDAEALHEIYSDADLMHWWSHGPHTTLDETRTRMADKSPDWRCWSITRQGDDTAIGFVAAGEKRQGNVTEIGYALAREHWGVGLAAEAVTRMIDQIFAEGQRRVFADTDPENTASRALLERLGFKLEGYLRAEWETHIGVRDTTLYGLLREEWRSGTA
ncbi:GNAT family N-acetyltransferase [Sphingomonas soli]|uniref:GNAT family N-acetyltransferase n=1 Tax=Sphingomonas soli TaxID=266127 RepID=UPI00082F0AD2|nr:GNAT family protein [Sphingomonas soli]